MKSQQRLLILEKLRDVSVVNVLSDFEQPLCIVKPKYTACSFRQLEGLVH